MPFEKRDKYFNPSKMLTQVLLVSGKKLNTATSLSVGLKLDPSGLQKLHRIFREGMEIFLALGCNSYTCKKRGDFNGRQAGLTQEFNLSHTTIKAIESQSVEAERICFINAGPELHDCSWKELD